MDGRSAARPVGRVRADLREAGPEEPHGPHVRRPVQVLRRLAHRRLSAGDTSTGSEPGRFRLPVVTCVTWASRLPDFQSGHRNTVRVEARVGDVVRVNAGRGAIRAAWVDESGAAEIALVLSSHDRGGETTGRRGARPGHT